MVEVISTIIVFSAIIFICIYFLSVAYIGYHSGHMYLRLLYIPTTASASEILLSIYWIFWWFIYVISEWMNIVLLDFIGSITDRITYWMNIFLGFIYRITDRITGWMNLVLSFIYRFRYGCSGHVGYARLCDYLWRNVFLAFCWSCSLSLWSLDWTRGSTSLFMGDTINIDLRNTEAMMLVVWVKFPWIKLALKYVAD